MGFRCSSASQARPPEKERPMRPAEKALIYSSGPYTVSRPDDECALRASTGTCSSAFPSSLSSGNAASLLKNTLLREEYPKHCDRMAVGTLRLTDACDRFTSIVRCMNSHCEGLLAVHDLKGKIVCFSRRVGFLNSTFRDLFCTKIFRHIRSGSRSKVLDFHLLLFKKDLTHVEILPNISNQKYFLLLLDQFFVCAGIL